MSNQESLQPGQVVDTLGELIASLSAFATKIPAASRMFLSGGVKPTEEAVEAYEDTVYRFRDRAGLTYKPLPPLFIKSLEAFEAGRVFDAVPPLLQCVEQLVDFIIKRPSNLPLNSNNACATIIAAWRRSSQKPSNPRWICPPLVRIRDF